LAARRRQAGGRPPSPEAGGKTRQHANLSSAIRLFVLDQVRTSLSPPERQSGWTRRRDIPQFLRRLRVKHDAANDLAG